MSILKQKLLAAVRGLTPKFVASATQPTAGTSLVINKPTGTLDGHLMVAVFSSLASNPYELAVSCSGWTQVIGGGNYGAGTGALAVLIKTASGEGASYTFTASTSSSGGIATYSDAKFGYLSIPVTDSASVVTATAVNPSVPATLLALFGSENTDITPSTPSGMTAVMSDVSGAPSWALFEQSVNSGTTGTKVSTVDTSGVGCLFYLLPNWHNPTRPTFVSSASAEVSGTAVTVDKPSGTVDGDLMVAICSTTASRTWIDSGGFTEVADLNATPGLRVAYKIAASEGANYTFTQSGSTLNLEGVILTFRNAAYDTIGAFGAAATPLVAPTVTASVADSLLLTVFAHTLASEVMVGASMYNLFADTNATAPSIAVSAAYIEAGATGVRGSKTSSATTNSAISLVLKPT